ncbi:unnamed protein product [Lampetra fluviatilis]
MLLLLLMMMMMLLMMMPLMLLLVDDSSHVPQWASRLCSSRLCCYAPVSSSEWGAVAQWLCYPTWVRFSHERRVISEPLMDLHTAGSS